MAGGSGFAELRFYSSTNFRTSSIDIDSIIEVTLSWLSGTGLLSVMARRVDHREHYQAHSHR
jgi:hypothetical protein